MESIARTPALGGKLALDSPAGHGTTVAVQLPLSAPSIDEPPAL